VNKVMENGCPSMRNLLVTSLEMFVRSFIPAFASC
jgi:hypothetical protein